jgi:hypothetical protein
MQPSCRHFVVTVEDCLAIGGHFYNSDTFDRTALGIVLQHFLGTTIINTEHSDATLHLMKLVHRYNFIVGFEGPMPRGIKESQ